MNAIKFNSLIACLFLLSLTNLNVVVIKDLAPITVFIAISPIFLFFVLIKIIKNFPTLEHLNVFYFLAGFTLLVAINIANAKITSVAYSYIYILFVIFIHYYSNTITAKNISLLSKYVIILYFINLFIAKSYYLIFGKLEPFGWFFQGAIDVSTTEMRFHGFSSEPSYAAFIILSSLIVYFRLTQDGTSKKIIILIFAFLSILLLTSVYGYILLSLFLAYTLFKSKYFVVNNFKNIIFITFFAIFGLLIFSIFIGNNDYRVNRLFLFLLSGEMNLENLNIIDSSTYMRVAPTIHYLEAGDWLSKNMYFGHGQGASSIYFGSLYNDAIANFMAGYESGIMNLGFFPAFIYDYGLFGVILIYICLLRYVCGGFMSLEFFVILLLVVNANFNTQLFWYVISMFYLMQKIANRQKVHILTG